MSVVPYGFASPSVRRFDLTPLNNIRSHAAKSFVPDDYVLLNGTPTTPQFWMNLEPLITADGTYYVERPSILDINDDAFVRFVPTVDTWDDIAFVWNPLSSQANVRYQMDGDVASAPLLSTTEYQIGKERFAPDVLDFGEDSVLTSDFNFGSDDAFSFTIAMALNAQSNSFGLITFLDGSYVNVVPTGLRAMVDGHKFSITLPFAPTARTPIYVVLDVTPPIATLVAAVSPTRMYQGTSAVRTRTTSFTFTVSGTMELMSLDIWGDDKPSYPDIIARYASVLGANPW
jgi:hypothetical protein